MKMAPIYKNPSKWLAGQVQQILYLHSPMFANEEVVSCRCGEAFGRGNRMQFAKHQEEEIMKMFTEAEE